MRISDWSSDVCSSDLRECFNGFFTKKLITTLDSGSGIVMMLAGALPRVADHFLTTRKIDMTINKALLALAMGFALAACSNQQQADDSAADAADAAAAARSEAHTSELQSLMRTSNAVFSLTTK